MELGEALSAAEAGMIGYVSARLPAKERKSNIGFDKVNY